MIGQRHERAAAAIQGIDRAGLDVVHPAMQVQQAFLLSQAYARVSLDVRQLGDDILAHHRTDFGRFIRVGPGLVDHLGRFGVLQPAADGGQVVHACALGNCRYRAAVGMAADHDVGHAEHRDRVLHRGRHTTWMGAVGGHDVAGVTDDEQLAEVIQHTAMATILPEPIATAERALRRIPLLGEGPRRGAALLRRKNNYHSAAALAFMDLVPGTDFY
ncbi:hypothetical protein EMIT0194P_310024 [Pseudomonas serbica]